MLDGCYAGVNSNGWGRKCFNTLIDHHHPDHIYLHRLRHDQLLPWLRTAFSCPRWCERLRSVGGRCSSEVRSGAYASHVDAPIEYMYIDVCGISFKESPMMQAAHQHICPGKSCEANAALLPRNSKVALPVSSATQNCTSSRDLRCKLEKNRT